MRFRQETRCGNNTTGGYCHNKQLLVAVIVTSSISSGSFITPCTLPHPYRYLFEWVWLETHPFDRDSCSSSCSRQMRGRGVLPTDYVTRNCTHPRRVKTLAKWCGGVFIYYTGHTRHMRHSQRWFYMVGVNVSKYDGTIHPRHDDLR